MNRARPSACKGILCLAVAVAVALGARAARSEEGAPATPRAEPVLPAGIEALPKEMLKRLDLLQAETARYRGLPLKQKVAIGQLGKEPLKKKVLEMFADELPKEVLHPMERCLKNFGLIPGEMDLGKYYPELLTSQIGGYYDPKLKYLVLVKDAGGLNSPEMEKMLGKEMAAKLDETVLVHEINHAIQDQHFDLQKFGHDKPLSDAATAKLALIEGDATLVMYSFMLNMPMERMPMVDKSLELFTEDPERLCGMMPDLPGSKELLKAPAYLRENLIFSYIQGLSFCIQVRKAGGQKLLDYAFAKDPPRSSEQILHPSKWLERRDDPLQLELADFSKALDGFAKVAEGSWGEFNSRLLLSEKLGQGARAKCVTAAAGWGGDAFRLYEKGGQEVLVWLTAWDSAQDAGEFYDAAVLAFKEGWHVALSGDKGFHGVTLVRGARSEEQYRAVRDALLSSKVTAPAAKPIDFAALGITEKDKASGFGLSDMQALLKDPALQGAMGEGAANLDLGKLMQDPALQKMLQEMLGQQKEQPKGRTEDGTYTNASLGLSIRQPKGEGWSMDEKPAKPPMGPTPLVQINGPNGATLVLALQELPIALPIETIGPMLEMGPKAVLKDFKKIAGDFVMSGKKKGYELEYTAHDGGSLVHILQRIFILDGKMVVGMGKAATEDWDKLGKDIREVLTSLTLPEKKPSPREKKTEDVLKE